MFRAMKNIWLVLAILFAAGQSMFGFALLGPLGPGNGEAFQYQVEVIGYDLVPPAGPVDVGTPKNLGAEYRMNNPNLYYACDASFLNFFGSNGLAAVDQAFGIMNNTLSNVSSYSSDLHEWTQNSSRFNYRATALDLLDLKSATLTAVIEQMALAEPTRWTWCLHDRVLPGGAVCPAYNYFVIQRNYDPVTQIYSSFVNGTLYGYDIIELCNVNPNGLAPLEADAVEYPVDPATPGLTAVADGIQNLELGQFYTGLTRDDVGGLRYLLATNRLIVEATESNSLLVDTNNFQIVVTSNLTTLFQAGLTNNPAALQALFPGLVIITNSSFFTNVVTTNVVATIVTSPFAPAGSPGTVVLTTVLTTNAVQLFTYTFGNVITNSSFTQGTAVIQTITTTNGVTTTNNGAPFSINILNGDFFLIPTNQCGFSIVSTNFASLIIATNFIASVTNTNGQAFTENLITFSTNHTLLLSVPNCVSNSIALREGIEKVHFFRQDFDSLLGQSWTPVTNTYHLTAVTNGAPVVQTLFRTTTQPDILFTAGDLTAGPAAPLAISDFGRSNPRFNTTTAGTAGPGTINLPILITMNTVGPIFANAGTSFLIPTDATQTPVFVWGSFDGTTNDPVIYPDSASLANLENQVFLQITQSGPLTNGIVNQPYTTTLQATGAQPPPYTWSMPTNSPTLPNGLNLASGTGVISGTPTATGIFDFIVQVADTTGRSSQRNFSIEIDP